MRRIYKYEISLSNPIIMAPANAHFLNIALQNGNPCIWAIVDPDVTEMWYYHIAIYGTGHPITSKHEYLGTVLMHNDSLVLHFFMANITKGPQ